MCPTWLIIRSLASKQKNKIQYKKEGKKETNNKIEWLEHLEQSATHTVGDGQQPEEKKIQINLLFTYRVDFGFSFHSYSFVYWLQKRWGPTSLVFTLLNRGVIDNQNLKRWWIFRLAQAVTYSVTQSRHRFTHQSLLTAGNIQKLCIQQAITITVFSFIQACAKIVIISHNPVPPRTLNG